MKRRVALGGLVGLTGSALLPKQVSAATEWSPDQPVKLVIGYSAGGAADAVGRILAAGLERTIGQPVIMDYRPGAGASVAAEYVARAPGDGYTIHLVDTGAIALIPNLRKVTYEPIRDFAPLSYVGAGSLVLLVNPKVPATDLASLLALLRANPDRFAYSSSGIGSPHHLAAELFAQRAKVRLVHVPYRGAAPALTDLMGGQVQLSFATLAPAQPLIHAGKVTAIGVTSSHRAAVLPQVPTIGEQGLVGYEATSWFAVVAPAKLNANAALRFRATLKTLLHDSTVIAQLEKLGIDGVSPRTPEEVSRLFLDDSEKWSRVIRAANIKLEG